MKRELRRTDGPGDRHLRFEIRGRRTGAPKFAAALKEAWRGIAAAIGPSDRRGLLVVMRLEGESISTTNMYEVASEVATLFRATGRRVAVVQPEGGRVLSEYRFGEDVAVNRGAAGRLFTDEASAAKWLEEGRAPGGEG